MGRYDGIKCPVCEKEFTIQDDVVVCPVCGAPHHRECYRSIGHCAFEEEHEQGILWEQRQEKQNDEKAAAENEQQKYYDGHEPIRCTKCGAINPENGIFCQICGTPLRQYNEQGKEYNPYENAQQFWNTNREQQGQQVPPISPFPFTTPFGGVSPDEEIEGITAREYALHVGDNSFYYIPRFRAATQSGQRSGWNWSAFMFHFLWFFYRKMYAIGAIVMVLFAISMIPAFIFSYHYLVELFPYLQSGLNYAADFAGMENLVTLVNVSRFLFFGVMLLCGGFGNSIYFKTCQKRIKEVRSEIPEYEQKSTEYANALAKKGRTSRKVLTIVGVTFLVIYLAVSFAISFAVIGQYMQ